MRVQCRKQKTNSFVIYFDVFIHTIFSDNNEIREREREFIKAKEQGEQSRTIKEKDYDQRDPIKGGPPLPSRCPFDGRLDSIG